MTHNEKVALIHERNGHPLQAAVRRLTHEESIIALMHLMGRHSEDVSKAVRYAKGE